MMKVVGEEGVAVNDFMFYLKAEFLDVVYLQQDAYDPVDACTSLERQRYVFSKVSSILKTEFSFEEKEEARHFFLELTQLFKDWNPCEWHSEEFKKIEAKIDEKLK